MSDITTRRAEEIREATGVAWEIACQQAERERDGLFRVGEPMRSGWDAVPDTRDVRPEPIDWTREMHNDLMSRQAAGERLGIVDYRGDVLTVSGFTRWDEGVAVCHANRAYYYRAQIYGVVSL